MTDDFVESGADATSLGQCPHQVGTAEWKAWQIAFAQTQASDPDRVREARERADSRLSALGLRLGGIDGMGLLNRREMRPRSPEEEILDIDPPRQPDLQNVRPKVSPEDALLADPEDADRIADADAISQLRWSPALMAVGGMGIVALSNLIDQAVKQEQAEQLRRWAYAQANALDKVYTAPILRGILSSEDEPRQIRGRPAGRQRTCQHGNPKGSCRGCSVQRRR
jgi:hypothetical protein